MYRQIFKTSIAGNYFIFSDSVAWWKFFYLLYLGIIIYKFCMITLIHLINTKSIRPCTLFECRKLALTITLAESDIAHAGGWSLWRPLRLHLPNSDIFCFFFVKLAWSHLICRTKKLSTIILNSQKIVCKIENWAWRKRLPSKYRIDFKKFFVSTKSMFLRSAASVGVKGLMLLRRLKRFLLLQDWT